MKSSASERGLRQRTMTADFSLKRALIQRELWEVIKKTFFWGGGGGGRLIVSEILIKVFLLQPIQ